jgi:hypothetical protein
MSPRKKRQKACKPGSVLRPSQSPGGWATIPLRDGLPRPSSNQPGHRAGTRLMWRPYSVLHPVGFTVPALLPGPRCALAAPFRPYPSEAGRCPFCGTFPNPLRQGFYAEAIENRRALPGTAVPWSPDFPLPLGENALEERPPGPLALRDMDYWGLGSNKARSLARHSPSMTPSMRLGRKRRWNAMTAFWGSVRS